jgi:hypothetical protein
MRHSSQPQVASGDAACSADDATGIQGSQLAGGRHAPHFANPIESFLL